jgi:hypothetical protein
MITNEPSPAGDSGDDLCWLLKDGLRQDLKFDPSLELDGIEDFESIRCPLCRWQPTASSAWYCDGTNTPEKFTGGCGTRWNTFETRGRCPGCAHQWRWTICLRCGGWSLHEEWYEERRQR